MSNSSEVKQLVNVGIVAAFATLAFVGTTIIRIPIPATGGYFNLGDTFVMIAALLYGPLIGGLVGLIGPAAADAIGFPQFILATAIVKGLEGAAIGAIGGKTKSISAGRVIMRCIKMSVPQFFTLPILVKHEARLLIRIGMKCKINTTFLFTCRFQQP